MIARADRQSCGLRDVTTRAAGLDLHWRWSARPRLTVIRLTLGLSCGGPAGAVPAMARNCANEFRQLTHLVETWLAGELAVLPLDMLALEQLTPFQLLVLTTLREKVSRGQVIGYGELAAAAGVPNAARAVGTVLRSNWFPLFFPCHRVICADGRLGGFQGGAAGTPLKRRLLELEGVPVDPLRLMVSPARRWTPEA